MSKTPADVVESVLKNIGYDIECSACMEIAWCGSNMSGTHSCSRDDDITVSEYRITVNAYKTTGKWYSGDTTELTDTHTKLYGFQISELIGDNHPDVRAYSPLAGGFISGYFYVVRIEYPSDFCNFLLDNR
jgi:hypothetical protein